MIALNKSRTEYVAEILALQNALGEIEARINTLIMYISALGLNTPEALRFLQELKAIKKEIKEIKG
ncbi:MULTISPECIES: hypothetical protein [unclassified Campylobacter]|uniref:hypothetical protein n=1 Tax=unclassified Campylobacter TaxID=2593542 RepID=UPI003D34A298